MTQLVASLTGLFFLSLVAVTCQSAYGGQLGVVLSDDTRPYEDVFDGLKAEIGNQHTLVRHTLGQSDMAEQLAGADLLIAVGVKAAETLAGRLQRKPLLAVLVTRDWFVHGGENQLSAGRRTYSVIFLDQPFSRQLELIRAALPQARSIGVVVSPNQVWQLPDLQAAAKRQRFWINEAVTQPDTRLVESLEKVLQSSDLLLALPDPDVLNRSTAQTYFLTAYRFRAPVVGYSQSISTAGALCSIYSTPLQIGRQAGEVASKSLSGETIKLPSPQYPKYFSISINKHVARSLGINLPDKVALARRLGAGPQKE